MMVNEVIIAKVNYFIDYWRDFLDSGSIEEELTHTIIYNPQELFLEFADEISGKELSNKDNKKFFFDSINRFVDFNIKSIKYLEPILVLIKRQFEKPNCPHLLHLLTILDQELSDNRLGLNCIEELAEILTNGNILDDSTKSKIKILASLIIFELIRKGYSTKSIKKFVANIFSNYTINQNIFLCTSFPHNYKIDFSVTEAEFEVYQEKIKASMDNLDLSKRILALKNYFNKDYDKLTYIFQIQGLTGEIDAAFDNVRIYNPSKVKLVKNYTPGIDSFNEFFDNEDLVYCNGAVTLEVFDDKYARQNAARLLSEVIDILVSGYSKYNLPIKINTDKILSCDQDGNQRGINSESIDEVLYHHKSIPIDKSNNIEYLSKYYNSKVINQRLDIDNKILESLHWKRRALDSLYINEKILWSWVSIENIFRDTELIFNIVPKLQAKNNLYEFAWKHFSKLKNINRLGFSGYHRNRSNISMQLATDIGLDKKEVTYYLGDFINNIENIKSELPNHILFCEQLDYLNKIFNNSKLCPQLLKNFEKSSQEKLRFTYRLRNKIVHNASRKNTSIESYYFKFISEVCSDILFEFIKKRTDRNLESVEEILNDIIYDFDRLKLDIESNSSRILLTQD